MWWDPYHCCVDFEALLLHLSEKKDKKIEFTHEHRPISASMASNVPGFEEAVHFDLTQYNDSPRKMIKDIISYLLDVSAVARDLKLTFLEQFKPDIMECISSDDFESRSLRNWVCQLVVFTFNGGRYDINLIKQHEFFGALLNDNIQFCPKKANRYLAIATDNLKFLDAVNFLSPGYNFDSYCKAFLGSSVKLFLPYELPESIDDLYKIRDGPTYSGRQ